MAASGVRRVPAWPAARQATFPPRSSPCGRAAGLRSAMADRPCRPSFSTATANHGAFEQRRANCRAVRRGGEPESEGDRWTGAPRARLYPHDRLRLGRARHLRALGYSRCRPRLVGRQSRRLLHRSARPGRHEGNAAFLPRSFGSAVTSEMSSVFAITERRPESMDLSTFAGRKRAAPL
jgi:hypothetical protein